jgi:hypothetical protein
VVVPGSKPRLETGNRDGTSTGNDPVQAVAVSRPNEPARSDIQETRAASLGTLSGRSKQQYVSMGFGQLKFRPHCSPWPSLDHLEGLWIEA